MTMHWDGTNWTRVATPNVGEGPNKLNAVLALAPNDAWAVGFSTPVAPPKQVATLTLIEHFDGTTTETDSGLVSSFCVTCSAGPRPCSSRRPSERDIGTERILPAKDLKTVLMRQGDGDVIEIEENQDEMLGRNVHTALSRNDWHLGLVCDLPSRSLQDDSSIDDPVNDTGLGPRCGDLQVSRELFRS